MGSVRLTTRQTFQYHGVLKPKTSTYQTLNAVGIDSWLLRLVMLTATFCVPRILQSELHSEAYEWAKKISEHLLPVFNAYAEIWLDGEKVESTEEPVLGSNYLPRKFKTTVAIPPQNDVDVHANDLNFIAIAENGKLIGFNVLVGGGFSHDSRR